MSIPSLAVICKTSQISDRELFKFIGALDTQLRRDFSPVWGTYAAPWPLRRAEGLPPKTWRLHIWLDAKEADMASALGYHTTHGPDHVPIGHVFLDRVKASNSPWTAIASHEVLEMLADEHVNLEVLRKVDGVHELWPREICDAVQGVYYDVEGVPLSDFVYPEYFIERSDGPFDHLKVLTTPFSLHSTGYSSVLRITPDGRALRRDRYGASYPSTLKAPRPGSRKSSRYGGLPCED